MTPEEKSSLINELADQFWPAKVVSKFSKLVEDRSILTVWFSCYFGGTDDIEESAVVTRQLQRILSGTMVRYELEYVYGQGLMLYVDQFSGVELSDEVQSQVTDFILDSVSESLIREQFTEFEAKFFESTHTTPADWHM